MEQDHTPLLIWLLVQMFQINGLYICENHGIEMYGKIIDQNKSGNENYWSK